MKKLISLSIALCLTQGVNASEILLLGVNDKGEEVQRELKADDYSNHLSKTLIAINNSVLERLPVEVEKSQNGYKLNKVSIGLGMSGEFGLGPWTLGAAVKHRIIFKR